MKKQAGFFSFCASILFSILLFQVFYGCGRQNLFPGSAGTLVQAREAYYNGDYATAIRLSSLVTSDATASAADKKLANFYVSQSIQARSGNSVISKVGELIGSITTRGGSNDVSSLFSNFVPTSEGTARADALAAANAINAAGIGTQDAQAVNVAYVNAQAATVLFTQAFDANGDGQVKSADVSNLTSAEVTALYLSANGSSSTFGQSGGISQYLNNTVNYGGAAGGTGPVTIESDALGTEGGAESLHDRFINGQISGTDLAKLFGSQ